MRVVFLDIDGVLNSLDWYQRRVGRAGPDDEIDPAAVARVQRLCEETSARIVVSSTWRLLHKLPKLRNILAQHGLLAPIIGVTPCLPGSRIRGDEIQLWLDRYIDSGPLSRGPIDGMVILDDDSDMGHLAPWLVRTPFETGFVDAHILDAKCVMAQAMPDRRVAS